MRRLLLPFLVVCLALGAAGPARADEQAELRAVIDKAVKARGGADKLAGFKAATWKGKGKFHGFADAVDITGDWAVQPPSQLRFSLELDFGGMKFQRVVVLNGDKGWIKMNDMLQEMDKDELAEQKSQAHHNRVTFLVLLKDKGYQLAPLGEAKVGDRPAVGVKVTHKDQRDVSLFFDKENGLLLKSMTRVKDVQTGQEQMQETFFADYREVDGLKHPMKVTIHRDGKLYLELEWNTFKPHDKLDDSVFGKP